MHYRVALTIFAASAGLALAVIPAIATGAPASHGQIAHWPMDGANCAGTLIMPRVMLTAGQCLRRRVRGKLYLRVDGEPVSAMGWRNRSRVGPVGDLGLVLLDEPYAGKAVGIASIPSYRQEQVALVDGNEALTNGTRLVAYTNGSPRGRWEKEAPQRLEFYLRHSERAGDEPTAVRPLVYRSIGGYRQFEPQRLGQGENPLLSPTLLRIYFPGRRGHLGPVPHVFGDAALNEALILTAGRDRDPQEGIASPIRRGERGGGLFYLDANGHEWLAGSVLGAQTHVRLSALWPWVFGLLLQNGMHDEAVHIARRALGTGEWSANDRKGRVGDIYLYENPYTQALEFFRLIGVDADGRYGYFPNGRKDSGSWEYLGTSLPVAHELMTPIRQWQAKGSGGMPGQVFVRVHPVSGEVQYFRLKLAVEKGTMAEPPQDATSNDLWEYLGKDLVV